MSNESIGMSGEIDSGRRQLGMSVRDVWVGYFSVGGNGSMLEVERWLSGASDIPAREHDMLAQAVNDRFTDHGLNHPVRYSDAL
ncbi:MAG: hypothetical protein ABR540_17680 [Acidimicrobiales bacterium]